MYNDTVTTFFECLYCPLVCVPVPLFLDKKSTALCHTMCMKLSQTVPLCNEEHTVMYTNGVLTFTD